MNDALPFALISLLATTAYVGVLLRLHFLPTGYQPIRHAVSDYAVGRYSRWFTVGLVASSAGVLTLAVGLEVAVGAPRLSTGDLWLLGLIAATRLGMSVFPTTLEGQRLTRTALLHYAFAIAAFTLTYLAISHLTAPLKLIHPWATIGGPLRWLAAAVGPELALVVATLFRPLRNVFGLFERIFLATSTVWLLAVTAALLVKTS